MHEDLVWEGFGLQSPGCSIKTVNSNSVKTAVLDNPQYGYIHCHQKPPLDVSGH